MNLEINYTKYDFNGKPRTETSSIEEIVLDQIFLEQILYKEDYGRLSIISKNRVNLENQPSEVCKAFGRLLNVLLDKGIINLDNLHEIMDSESGLRNSAVLKQESKD